MVYNVHPDELYEHVKRFNHYKFIYNLAVSRRSTVLMSYYRKEMERVRALVLKRYKIILE